MARCLAILALFVAGLAPLPAVAQVMLAFHSFNGSYLGGRYPHAFVTLDGTLDSTGEQVHENFGYSTSASALSALSGLVPGIIQVEKDKYVTRTNVHFTVPISDAQYRAIIAEVSIWRDAPGQKRYSLDHRNCIHFVARIAEIAGLKAQVPQDMVRRPKKWLNFIARLNPQLGAPEVR